MKKLILGLLVSTLSLSVFSTEENCRIKTKSDRNNFKVECWSNGQFEEKGWLSSQQSNINHMTILCTRRMISSPVREVPLKPSATLESIMSPSAEAPRVTSTQALRNSIAPGSEKRLSDCSFMAPSDVFSVENPTFFPSEADIDNNAMALNDALSQCEFDESFPDRCPEGLGSSSHDPAQMADLEGPKNTGYEGDPRNYRDNSSAGRPD